MSRIRASVSGSAFNCNLAQPPQSLIKTICFPQLFGVNTKGIQHGYKYEDKQMPTKLKCKFSTDEVWTHDLW